MDASAAKALLLTPANKAWQKEHHGLKNPMALLGRLQKGEAVEICADNGKVVVLEPSTLVSAPKPGRVIAVIGDSSDSSAAAPLMVGADLLVHEATNAALPDGKGGAEDEATVTARTIGHGHSTPRMAGALAKACAVQTLALTHFSSRYKGDDSEESLAVMDQIVGQAMEECVAGRRPVDGAATAAAEDVVTVSDEVNVQGQNNSGGRKRIEVFAARDLMEIDVSVKRRKISDHAPAPALPLPSEARRLAVLATAQFDALANLQAGVKAASEQIHEQFPPAVPLVDRSCL